MNLVQLHFRLQLFSEQAAYDHIRPSLAVCSLHGQIDLLFATSRKWKRLDFIDV